jgi:hypothetical protein
MDKEHVNLTVVPSIKVNGKMINLMDSEFYIQEMEKF